MKLLYESILLLYALSLLGFFIDFIQHNQKAKRLAFWLLCLVWVIQTVFLCKQIILEHAFPIGTLTDSLFFYSWILITFSLLINQFFHVHFIVLFTNIFGFFILLFYTITSARERLTAGGIDFVNEILVAHIAAAIISYGFFTLSFVFSLMYLMQYQLLKNKRGWKWLRRLGNMDQLDRLSFHAITIGVPMLFIGLLLGFSWAYDSGAVFYWLDMKTLGSILVLFVYVFYLVLRLGKGYKGKSLVIFNLAAFLILLANFFLSTVLSNFHFSI
ncbi:cytochrome c biogenesis protein CcsA [Virgibacillus sp. 179-BFC.A HS]|uniref:Cytochrome c biogenesis protein CcsA n=1 Tax=Tigheibacillus jepli TaxID=3035914 RepID=A0ABU5CGI1_9BACI|nr:cytochrome c biogenesis protein CcsA [Virgibacillus sp. 179-BFC.A HS]MDY0405433.1 cytochrome c biogenesis protein CcsA [Virgibacillus sp. 179-BFC.A HS]